jgi:integrase
MPYKTSRVGDLELRFNNRTRKWAVPIPIAGTNRRKWISTGCRTLSEASAIIAESGVNRLVALANSQAVTAAAIQIITSGRKVTCLEILGSLTMESDGRWAASTLSIYRTELMAFFGWNNCLKKPLVDVTREEILAWVNHGGASLATRQARMKVLRVLYRYARARNFVLENPAETAFIERRKMTHEELEPREVLPFTIEEFRKIVDSPDTSSFWKGVTSLAYWTGLRFSDCVTLEWSSVSETELIVWTRKRGRRVALPLADPLLGGGELSSVLSGVARATSGPSRNYLWPTQREQYLSGKRSRFPTAFAVLLEKLGIQGKTFHSTRHAAATRFAAAGKTLEEIGRILAHSDTTTTENYIHGTIGIQS